MRTPLMTAVIALGLALAPAACKKNEKQEGGETTPDPTTEDTAATTDQPSGDPAGGHGSGTGGGTGGSDMVNKMMHCPSAVEGAATKVEQTAEAVIVSVTVADAAQVAEVQKRAKHLASLTAAPSAEVKHTGQGTGGGALGKCPVVMKDVTLSVDDLEDGAKVTMKPKNAADLAELAKTAQDRAAALAAAGDAAGGADGDAETGDEMGDEQ